MSLSHWPDNNMLWVYRHQMSKSVHSGCSAEGPAVKRSHDVSSAHKDTEYHNHTLV